MAKKAEIKGTAVQSKEFKAAKMAAILEAQKVQQEAKAKAKAEKAAKSSKPGIIKTILNTVIEAGANPISREQILEVLLEQFAGEGSKHTRETMTKTITMQLGVKRMMRIERENDIVLDVTEDAEGNRLFGYSAE